MKFEFNYNYIGILGQVWYLIASIPDLCNLTYFQMAKWFLRKLCFDVLMGLQYERPKLKS